MHIQRKGAADTTIKPLTMTIKATLLPLTSIRVPFGPARHFGIKAIIILGVILFSITTVTFDYSMKELSNRAARIFCFRRGMGQNEEVSSARKRWMHVFQPHGCRNSESYQICVGRQLQ